MGRENLLFLAIILSVFLVSCGKKESHSVSGVQSSSVIIGDLDWSEVTIFGDSEPWRVNSKFVADIRIPSISSRCTGFMISEDYLMTNQHCISGKRDARGVEAIFNHESNVSSSRWKRYKCDEYITSDILLDFAILKCSGSPGIEFGYAKFSDDVVAVGDGLYVVQQNCDHQSDPGCDYTKKISFGEIIGLDLEIVHNADTLGGSSGSPVFNNEHEVVGLHHGGAISRTTGEGIANFAVPSTEIMDFIERNHPEVLPSKFEGLWLDSGDNNKIKKANDVSFDQNEISFGGKIDSKKDKDYYKIVLESEQLVNFMVEFKHSVGDLNIRLYNSKKRKIKQSCSKTDNEQITTKLQAGTYYLRVKGRKKATSKYSVNITSLE